MSGGLKLRDTTHPVEFFKSLNIIFNIFSDSDKAIDAVDPVIR